MSCSIQMRKKKKMDIMRDKKRKEKESNLNSPLLLKRKEKKRKSSKLSYLISFTYRFKIWSHFSFLIQMRESKDKGDMREKKETRQQFKFSSVIKKKKKKVS